NNAKVLWESNISSSVRDTVINAYGQAFRNVFIALIPMSAVGFIASLLLKRSKYAPALGKGGPPAAAA
ncbi:hypothetical protein EV182_003702, partial [Spiromyces aspiralis]